MQVVPELDAHERESLFRIINNSLRIRKRHQFFLWVQMELRSLLPHEILICGLNDGNGKGICMHTFSNESDFTPEHFESVTHPKAGLIPQLIDIWQKTGQPCLLDSGNDQANSVDKRFVGQADLLRASGLRNIAAHGVLHSDGAPLGFFCFSRLSERLGVRHGYLLEILVPHLYTALVRVLSHEQSATRKIPFDKVKLTAREKEVLTHMHEGLSNSAIAELLQVSPLTIKNHVQKILYKLQANNRAHAITQAMRCGLIHN